MCRLWHLCAGWLTGTLFKHYKGGLYRQLYIAQESTNVRQGRPVVVYFSIKKGIVHTRDLDEWNALVPGNKRRFEAVP